MPDYILKFSLFGGAFLCAGYLFGWHLTRRREARARQKVSRALTRAWDALEVLKQQMDLITSHSQEYFHTLVLADFPVLQELVKTLNYLLEQADEMAREGDLVRALAIALWVQDPDNNRPPNTKRITKEHRDIVAGWIPRSRELLIRVTEAMEIAHAENIDSGVKRVRKDRRPTELDLRRLRENLLFSRG